jgi:hypothetical protein
MNSLFSEQSSLPGERLRGSAIAIDDGIVIIIPSSRTVSWILPAVSFPQRDGKASMHGIAPSVPSVF